MFSRKRSRYETRSDMTGERRRSAGRFQDCHVTSYKKIVIIILVFVIV